MALARSKVTARGQTTVPACVRRKLGIGPGSVLRWDEEGEKIVVRRAVASEDMRRAVFPDGPPKRRTLKELKKGIGDYIQERHAQGRY
jgi:AbrB family looped-hinge helix DNA binding protein